LWNRANAATEKPLSFMNVSGFTSQRAPAGESQRETDASKEGSLLQASPCFLAKASMTTQPTLWRVFA
jgi:hypothetical protein